MIVPLLNALLELESPWQPSSVLLAARNRILSAEKSLKLFKTPNARFFECHAEQEVPLGLGSSQRASIFIRNSSVQVFDLPPPPKQPKSVRDFFSKGDTMKLRKQTLT